MDTSLPDQWRAALDRAGYADADARTRNGEPIVVRGDRRTSLTVVPLLDDDARNRCSEHLARWRGVDDPGVEQLDDAIDLGDAVALARPLAGVTLAEFVEAQGRLSAGQASTLLVVLGRALARLHAASVVYGPMTMHDVVLVDGQPRLVVPAPHDGAAHAIPQSPAEDAYHLAALTDSVIAAAYGADAPAQPAAVLRALHRTIISALGDAQSRPGVGTLASLSHDIAACQPLVILEPPPSFAHADGARGGGSPVHSRWLRAALSSSLVLLLALAATAAWWTGTRESEDTANAPPSAGEVSGPLVDGPVDGPAAAAAELTVDRFDLLAQMTAAPPDIDARAWADVTVPGSPAHIQVLDLVAVLVADGSTLTGLSATVESASVLTSDGTSARVEVVYTTSEYAVRRADGRSVVPAAGPQSAELTLELTDVGWRVSEVTETSATPPPSLSTGA